MDNWKLESTFVVNHSFHICGAKRLFNVNPMFAISFPMGYTYRRYLTSSLCIIHLQFWKMLNNLIFICSFFWWMCNGMELSDKSTRFSFCDMMEKRGYVSFSEGLGSVLVTGRCLKIVRLSRDRNRLWALYWFYSLKELMSYPWLIVDFGETLDAFYGFGNENIFLVWFRIFRNFSGYVKTWLKLDQ